VHWKVVAESGAQVPPFSQGLGVQAAAIWQLVPE
jgi:hypothetical protein